jgi:hypothetical protein
MPGDPWVWWALAVVAGAMIAAFVAIVLIAWLLNRRVNDQRRPASVG